MINPMWDLLKDRVRPEPYGFGRLCVGGIGDLDPTLHRFDLVSQYAWTITAPETVAFVAEHLRGWAVDPLAGSGYWAFLLAQCGVDVVASDERPPTFDKAHNKWHHHGAHWTVGQAHAVDAVREAGSERALLLSWPPYAAPIGAEIVSAFTGDRIVYIGEGWGGCCGDDNMFALFEKDWVRVADHCPLQFWGIHDEVTVYDRQGVSL